jgi:hypothetical protein
MTEISQCRIDVKLFDDLSIPRYEIGEKKKRPQEAYLPKSGRPNLFLKFLFT